MSFDDDLKAQLAAEKETAEVPFALNANPYVLKFTALDPWEWAEAGDHFPPRPGVALDRNFGYNMRDLVRSVAPRIGQLLRDGVPVEVDDWDALFKALSPAAVQRTCSAVFALHESETLNAVVSRAKKLRKPDAESSPQQ